MEMLKIKLTLYQLDVEYNKKSDNFLQHCELRF